MLQRCAGVRALVDDQVDVRGVLGAGAHPLPPGRHRPGEALLGELGERGRVLGGMDDHLVRPGGRHAREQVRLRPPARGPQRVDGARQPDLGPLRGSLARHRLGTPGGEHRVKIRHRALGPSRRVGRPAAGPIRPDLGRGAILAALAERAGLGRVIPPRGGNRDEGVRALRPPGGEDRPQAGELVYADLGVAQEPGGGSGSSALARARAVAPAPPLDKGFQQVDREREDDRRVLVHADVDQRLQVAELERRRVAAEDLGRLGQLLRRLELAVGGDDLRPPLALGLGLARDRPLHLLRQLDVLDLDRAHLHAPGLGLLVDDLL